jgi:hypothetical protein
VTTIIRRSNTLRVQGRGNTTITLDRRTVAQIRDNRPAVAIADPSARLVVNQQPNIVVPGGAMGVQGPQGIPGDGGAFSLTAGAGGISALRIVVAEAGVARYPDIEDADDAERVVGLAYTAASAGGSVTVQSDGAVTDSNWNWSPGSLWCGANGVLTQTPPAAPAWLMEVGRVLAPTRILLDIQPPILRPE